MHLIFIAWAVPSCFRRGRFLLCVAFSLFLLLPALPAMTASAPDRPTITLAIAEESMPPYYMVDRQAGTVSGLWREMLDELFEERLGWQVDYLIRPWPRAQNEVRLGQADGMISIVTTDRQGYTVVGKTPLCSFPLHLFTWLGHPRFEEMGHIESVADIQAMGFKLVSNLGNGWYQDTIERSGVATTWLPTDEQMVRFVAAQRGDGFIDVPRSIDQLTTRLGLADKIINTGVSFGKVPVHLLISKDSPFAARIDEIDAALARCRAEGHCLGSPSAPGYIDNTAGDDRLFDCGLVR